LGAPERPGTIRKLDGLLVGSLRTTALKTLVAEFTNKDDQAELDEKRDKLGRLAP
jgi:hypothetical protein